MGAYTNKIRKAWQELKGSEWEPSGIIYDHRPQTDDRWKSRFFGGQRSVVGGHFRAAAAGAGRAHLAARPRQN